MARIVSVWFRFNRTRFLLRLRYWGRGTNAQYLQYYCILSPSLIRPLRSDDKFLGNTLRSSTGTSSGVPWGFIPKFIRKSSKSSSEMAAAEISGKYLQEFLGNTFMNFREFWMNSRGTPGKNFKALLVEFLWNSWRNSQVTSVEIPEEVLKEFSRTHEGIILEHLDDFLRHCCWDSWKTFRITVKLLEKFLWMFPTNFWRTSRGTSGRIYVEVLEKMVYDKYSEAFVYSCVAKLRSLLFTIVD